jgi:hypothetical protein
VWRTLVFQNIRKAKRYWFEESCWESSGVAIGFIAPGAISHRSRRPPPVSGGRGSFPAYPHLPPCPSSITLPGVLPFPVSGIPLPLLIVSVSSLLSYPLPYLSCPFPLPILLPDPSPLEVRVRGYFPRKVLKFYIAVDDFSTCFEQEIWFLVQGFEVRNHEKNTCAFRQSDYFCHHVKQKKMKTFLLHCCRWVLGFSAFSGFRNEKCDFRLRVRREKLIEGSVIHVIFLRYKQ